MRPARLVALAAALLLLVVAAVVLWPGGGDAPTPASPGASPAVRAPATPVGDELDGAAPAPPPPTRQARIDARDARAVADAESRKQLYAENLSRLNSAAERAEAEGNAEYATALRERAALLAEAQEAERAEAAVAAEKAPPSP